MVCNFSFPPGWMERRWWRLSFLVQLDLLTVTESRTAYSNATAYTEHIMEIKRINTVMTYNATDELYTTLKFLVLQTGTNVSFSFFVGIPSSLRALHFAVLSLQKPMLKVGFGTPALRCCRVPTPGQNRHHAPFEGGKPPDSLTVRRRDLLL